MAVWTADQTLNLLSTAPDHTDEDAMYTIERFINHHTDLRHNKHRIRYQQGMPQTVCKEKQHPADPTNKCSPGAKFTNNVLRFILRYVIRLS